MRGGEGTTPFIEALLDAVADVLGAHGGALELEYETELWMATAMD